eukprot:365126-Chlamydomonas_euryale.AAC.26
MATRCGPQMDQLRCENLSQELRGGILCSGSGDGRCSAMLLMQSVNICSYAASACALSRSRLRAHAAAAAVDDVDTHAVADAGAESGATGAAAAAASITAAVIVATLAADGVAAMTAAVAAVAAAGCRCWYC